MPRLFCAHKSILCERAVAQRNRPSGGNLAVQLIGQRGRKEFPAGSGFAPNVSFFEWCADDDCRHVGSFFPLRTAVVSGQLCAHEKNSGGEIKAVELGDFPRPFAGGELPVVILFGLEHETTSPRHLRNRLIRTNAPGQRFEAMTTRDELDLVGCVRPVFHIRSVWSACDALAVQEKFKSFVGAHVNAQRRCNGFKLTAKTQENRSAPPSGKKFSM